MLDILQSNDLKKIFENQIQQLPQDVALCLSGGIDSIALLSMLLEFGKNIHIYTFTLNDYISDDFRIAESLASRFNCEFNAVILPSDLEILKSDILKLHTIYGCRKKTDYECIWPFLYVYPNIKESIIVTGLGAEGHFGSTKKGSIHYKNNLDEFRQMFFANDNVSQIKQHTQLCKEYSLAHYFPFLTDDIKNYFMGKEWNDVNKPKAKQPIIDLISFDVKIKSSNLQLGSRIALHFDRLLQTNWNLHNYKSVVGIFNSVNKGELPNERQRKLI